MNVCAEAAWAQKSTQSRSAAASDSLFMLYFLLLTEKAPIKSEFPQDLPDGFKQRIFP